MELIRKVSGEYDLEQVRYLLLEQQGIDSLQNITLCINLVQLNLSRNKLGSIAGLQVLLLIERLDLSHNQLRRIEELESLTRLHWLDLRDNNISYIDDVSCLARVPALHALFLQAPAGDDQNPVCQYPAYANNVFRTLPQLNILDGTHLTLVSAVDQLEEQLAAITPDLTGFPAVTETPWFSELQLHQEAREVFSSVEESADAVSASLSATRDALSKADQVSASCAVIH